MAMGRKMKIQKKGQQIQSVYEMRTTPARYMLELFMIKFFGVIQIFIINN